ncbi:glycosyltransferase family 2 protein [Defluviimonas sp. WL0024]|uniref:Glycosyltransferase family 2 protein n=2 Tax=Albidovulum TaxID=205889 RepID=A0ABT3J9V7_9RHOB|nr:MULTISPECIES: glycosyltransferase family 2 protein [Defluviimonas]MCU9850458.1 glycosyltransferase family 2 protein [Defluviimonas sp. WL0024]MCW3784482.1 glycosyltransferase family 2 protein [Defluviimonas salinarum]
MVTVSIVIPAKNEAENITGLLDAIDAACTPHVDHEVIVVDDGSDDDTARVVWRRMESHPNLRLIRHDVSGGQSAAVHSGVLAAKGGIVCTLDGDGQNPPEELPKLFAPLLAPGSEAIGIVAGQRVGRQDTMSKKLASRFANTIRSWALQDGTRDTGCGLKGFRRDAFLRLPFFNHMHRYLPALFARDGWQVAHVDVSHRPRGGGRSKYNNLQRGLVGAVDLLGVMWLLRRRKKSRPAEAEAERG